MGYLIEELYNVVEVAVIMFFISMYFKPKPRFSVFIDFTISAVSILILESILAMFELHWFVTLIIVTALVLLIASLFYASSLSEKIVISFISVFLLALTDVIAFTLISGLLGAEYQTLVENSSISRFLAVLCSKAIYIIAVSVIIFFKKRFIMILSKLELSLILVTLLLSGVQIALIRNIIYETKDYYNIFLIILLCSVIMNIVIYYMILYIGKKNVDEKNYSLMQKQLELQGDSLKNLERKYYETAKIRHDFKNYISCALDMAKKGSNTELAKFLEEISEEKINDITSYVATKRGVIGAVLNSKLSKAKNIGADMQCYILSELEDISDMDIGIILANLTDNALEACEKNKGRSEILLKTWTEAGYYFIEITNTVETDVLSENPELKTSKKNSELHGVGLRSVRDIVEKYDGMIGFDQKGNVFRAFISLAKEIS